MADLKYKAYTVEDLVLDPDFRKAVLDANATPDFLRDLRKTFPEKRSEIDEARALLLRLHRHYADRPGMAPAVRMRMYETILREGARPKARSSRWSSTHKGLAAAAAVLLLVLAAWYLFLPTPSTPEQVYRTAYGETAEIRLPDGSLVTLNANSTLRYVLPWPAEGSMEVWLRGEAYFDITSKHRSGRSFIVHTEGPDVVVLGTRFNVNTRTEGTQILLEEGSIRLDQPARSGPARPVQTLAPGELAEYRPDTGLRIQRDIPPQTLSSWKDGYLLIEGYTFTELMSRIESMYGLQIDLAEDFDNVNRVKGALPTRNLDETIKTLEILYNLEISRRSDRLIIARRRTETQPN